nr:uncharacterized protein LOC104095643 [Nicotiana tomentosiformis]
MKAQALADHLAENPVDDKYESLNTYFSDEEVNLVEEVVQDDSQIWKLYFDGAVNIKSLGIGTILVSPTGQHYPATARLRFFCTNNTAEYEACIMVGATPYLLVYGTEAVIPAEIEIPSLRIIVEAGIEDTEWVKSRLEQLNLIDEKRLAAVCFGQLYQQRMARAYNKKVRPRKFEVGQLVLKRIFPHQEEAKGKFAPNWQGPYLVKKVLSKGALHLVDIEGKVTDISVNADAVKRYYV